MLGRVSAGIYGTCEICRQPISVVRDLLIAAPLPAHRPLVARQTSARLDPLGVLRHQVYVTGTVGRHLSKRKPYRDPAGRAAWMRGYRQRKCVGQVGAPSAVSSSPSVVRAPEPSRVSLKTILRSVAQPAAPNAGLVRKAPRSGFKTALGPGANVSFRAPGLTACPYCYNTGYSSPGTYCSYCRNRGR